MPTPQERQNTVLKTISLITDRLNDEEFLAISNAILLGTDPRQSLGYKKARGLFLPDGIHASQATVEAIDTIVQQRLGKQ